MNHNPERQFELAPAGILRAAAWPIESIQCFGSQNLAQLALAAIHTQDADTWQQYIIAYRAVHSTEREQLWQMTGADSWFMKSLLLSNSGIYAAVQRLLPHRQEKRRKAMRHLETTLYRYLARAAGRTTPYGLWAGVRMVEFGESARQDVVPAKYHFSPDLRPFQSMLRSLAQRPIYRQRSTWRLNPTLQRQADGCWHFWSRSPNGVVEQQAIEPQELVDILLTELAKLDLGKFDELVTGVAASPRWYYTSGPEDILDLFIDRGVLVGGLDLPHHFSHAWEALNLASEKLIAADRLLWQDTIQKLHSQCATLAADLETISVETLADRLQQAHTWIEQLAQSLGIALAQIFDPVLHCDLGVPWQITLNPSQRDVLVQTIADYQECWIDRASPASALRLALRVQIQQEFAAATPLGALQPTSIAQISDPADPEVAARLQAWENKLAQQAEEVMLEHSDRIGPSTLAAAPFGCLFTSIFSPWQLVVQGIGDEPVRFFARFSDLCNTDDRLHSWFQQQIDSLAHAHQIQIAAFQGPFERNPNMLARPHFHQILSLELWGATPGTASLQGAAILIDPQTQLPMLKLRSHSQPVGVFWFSSAAIASQDPISEQILWTSFQDNPMAIFRAATVPMPIELATPRFTPRILLPGKAVLRPRRTVLSGSILAELVTLAAIELFARWQQLADEHSWSLLLYVQIQGKPPLIIPRDSPLALESLFKQDLRAQTDWLIVEEVVDQPWLVDAQGQHYMAELAIPFARKVHGWSKRRTEEVIK